MPKRLIEDVLPLGDLHQVAQKGGGTGSPNAMHPYFARRRNRPLSPASPVRPTIHGYPTLPFPAAAASVAGSRRTRRRCTGC